MASIEPARKGAEYMKKQMAVVVLCVMLLSACAAAASEADSRFVGDWYVNTFRIGESSFNAGDSGMVIKITAEADGTATWTDPDGSQDMGTWTSEGDNMLISWDNGGLIELTYIDGALVSNPQEGSLVIHLEGSMPKNTSDWRPDYRKDAKAVDFDGNWMSVSITAHGITIPMGELGERVDPQIRNGKLVALNGSPVDPSVTTDFLSSTLIIYNPIVDVTSVMNLLADGSAVLMHLHLPEAYFTLIPVP